MRLISPQNLKEKKEIKPVESALNSLKAYDTTVYNAYNVPLKERTCGVFHIDKNSHPPPPPFQNILDTPWLRLRLVLGFMVTVEPSKYRLFNTVMFFIQKRYVVYSTY
jgi:hypothetical protein